MRSAPLPPDETERLASLQRYAILDTPAEEVFDGLARVARALVDAPVAVVGLTDRDRQWFKARSGFDLREIGRDIAFCPHVVHAREPLHVPDARADPRFADNPLVTRGPAVRFYCGVPLLAPDGTIPGTLSVWDRHPRADLPPDRIERLQDLAAAVIGQMEYRLAAARARRSEPERRLHRRLLEILQDRIDLGTALTDTAGRIVDVNGRMARLVGVDASALVGRDLLDWLDAAASPGSAREARLQLADGGRMPVRHVAERIRVGEGRDHVFHTLADLRRIHAERLLQRGRADVLKRIARRAEPERTLHRIAELPALSDPDAIGYVLVHRDQGEPLIVAPGLDRHGAGAGAARALAVLDARARATDPAHPAVVEQFDRQGAELASFAQTAGLLAAAVIPLYSEEDAVIGSLGVMVRPRRSHAIRSFDLALREMSQLAAITLHHSTMLARLQWQAHHDELTGLGNRTLLRERLRAALEIDPDESLPLIAVFLFDLDRFKEANDRYGHAAGDWILRRVAERVRGILRSGDTFSRLGGDEFVVFTPVARVADAGRLAGKITLAASVSAEGVGTGPVTASVGVALYPEHGRDVDALLQAADRAMYTAKKAGGDRWSFPDPA